MANLVILFMWSIFLVILHVGIKEFLIMKQLLKTLIVELRNVKNNSIKQPFLNPSNYTDNLNEQLLEKTKKLQNPTDKNMELELASFINELPTQNKHPLSFSDETVFGMPWDGNALQFEKPF